MGSDKQNMNKKRRIAWKKFMELYHPDTEFELIIYPAGSNTKIIFLSDFMRMKKHGKTK